MWYFLVRRGGGEEEDWFWFLTGGHSIYSVVGRGTQQKRERNKWSCFTSWIFRERGNPKLEAVL